MLTTTDPLTTTATSPSLSGAGVDAASATTSSSRAHELATPAARPPRGSASHAGVQLPPVWIRRADSPIGRIELISDGDAITSLKIESGGTLPFDHLPEQTNDVLELAVLQLGEYFAGDRHTFDVPVHLTGTVFQREIWARLAELEWGEVVSYGELGLSTGRATAGRAVGGAVGANPVPLIVPCHRVLASNHRITGYSAGEGVPTKSWLLDHEGIEHVK